MSHEDGEKGGARLLPIVPSTFFACHHFPCLSTMSRISPFEKEISFGSSGEATSEGAIYEQEPGVPRAETHRHRVLSLCRSTSLVLGARQGLSLLLSLQPQYLP